MPAALDLTNKTFGKLSVLRASGKDSYGAVMWLCRCECGKESTVRGSHLKAGRTAACHSCAASARATTHGQSHSALYYRWRAMLDRTGNPNNLEFHNYGGRGIYVCERWKTSFEAFAEDMGETFNESLELDRVDVNGGYSSQNCRWANRTQQQRNRRNNRILTFNGRSMTVVEWAEESGVKANTLQTRLKRGWPIERVLKEVSGNA